MIDTLRALPWRRFIKFAITGGTAFAIDFSIYFVLTRFAHVPYIGARAISIAMAFTWNFLLNRYWTFRATEGKIVRQASRFVTVMTVTSLLNLGLMHIGVDYLHFNDLLVIIVVSLLIMGVNYMAHQLWSYK